MVAVSVIIPIYNIEKFLEDCLISVAKQTYGDFEAILVDDGSTDGCYDICIEWCKKDERFKYFYKENGGLGSARNYGIEKSNGQWITFLDSDDWWELTYLEKMMSRTQDISVDVIYCDAYVCQSGVEKRIARIRSIFKYIDADVGDRIAWGINASAWGALYRKSKWDAAEMEFPSIIYEDTAVYGVIVCFFSAYDVVEMPLYNYRKRIGSIMDVNKYAYEKMIFALRYLLALAREKKFFNDYCIDYLALCQSQLYLRWKNYKDKYSKQVKRKMMHFYIDNFPSFVNIGRIASIGSHISAKVYENIALFPDVDADVYAFTTIPSIMSDPLSEDFKLTCFGTNEYRMKMVKKDLKKTWRSRCKKIDYIIMDLLEERNGLFSFDGGVFTASEAVNSEYNLNDDIEMLSRDAVEEMRWRECCDDFFGFIKQNGIKVILLELYLCEEYGDFKNRNTYSNLNEIQQINIKLKSYYEYIYNKYDVVHICLNSKYRYTDYEYKFGCYPWYYNNLAIYELCKKVRCAIYSKTAILK